MKLLHPLSLMTLALTGTSLMYPMAEELDQAMVKALQASHLLVAEEAQTDVLAARHMAAIGGYLPDVRYDYATGKGRTRRDNTPWLDGQVTTQGFTLAQPLVDVAALQGMSAAKARLDGGREIYKARIQEVLLETVAAYAELAQARDVVKLEEQDANRLGKHVMAEEERFGAGVNTRTDILQAQARLAEAKGRLHTAKGRLATAEAAYVRVTGGKAVGEVALPIFPRDLPGSLEEALEEARTRNPELLAAQEEARAAKRDVTGQRATRLPTVDLLARTGRDSGIADANGIEETRDESVMVNVRVPLFAKGLEYAGGREARAMRLRAEQREMALQEVITERVTAVWARLQEGEASLEALTQAVNAAEATMDGLEAEFNSGNRTGLDVLDARRDVMGARLSLLEQRKEMLLDAYRLLGLMDGLKVATGEGL